MYCTTLMAISMHKFKCLSMKRIRLKSVDHLEFFGEVVFFSSRDILGSISAALSSRDIHEQKDRPKADFPSGV